MERKRAEEALLESEEHCRRLVEISPDAILVHSEDRFVLVNEAAVKLLGASGPEQLIGKPIVDFVQPKDRSAVQEDVLKPADPGQSALFVKRKLIRQGKEFQPHEPKYPSKNWFDRTRTPTVTSLIFQKFAPHQQKTTPQVI